MALSIIGVDFHDFMPFICYALTSTCMLTYSYFIHSDASKNISRIFICSQQLVALEWICLTETTNFARVYSVKSTKNIWLFALELFTDFMMINLYSALDTSNCLRSNKFTELWWHFREIWIGGDFCLKILCITPSSYIYVTQWN